jgi:type II secretory pathway component PulF
MPVFTYEAITPQGAVARGSLAAESVEQLESELRERRLELVRTLRARPDRGPRQRRVKLRDVAELARYVSITCRGGLPILESLEDFARQTLSPAMKAVLDEVVRDVRNGTSISEAMARHRATFGDEVVALTQAGEASGAMDEVMRRLSEQLEFHLDVRGKVRGALIYPCILAVAVAGLVILLVTFLLPRVVGMLAQNDVELPAPTRALLGVSGFLTQGWAPLLAAGVAAVAGLRALAATRTGAVLLDRCVHALPIVGPLVKMGAESRFTATLRTLLAGGVEAVSSLEMAADSCGAPSMTEKVRGAAQRLREGRTFSEALRGLDLFHPLVVRMVELGERSGHMDESLEYCVGYFAAELPKAVRRCTAALEPLIVCFAGLVVGFVLLATLLPVFSMYEAV